MCCGEVLQLMPLLCDLVTIEGYLGSHSHLQHMYMVLFWVDIVVLAVLAGCTMCPACVSGYLVQYWQVAQCMLCMFEWCMCIRLSNMHFPCCMHVHTETVVFLYIGMQVFAIRTSFRVELIIWSLILILIGRAANIFPLSFLVNRFRSIKISSRMQFIMWFSGKQQKLKCSIVLQACNGNDNLSTLVLYY